MKILIVANTLTIGGAEWFLMRQADYFRNQNHQVIVFNARPDISDKNFIKSFPNLSIRYAPKIALALFVLIDRIWKKMFGKELWIDFYNKVYLKKIIKKFNPDVIQSHLVTADYLTYLANKEFGKKHIVTNHGDYIAYSLKNDKQKVDQMKTLTDAVDKIVVISEAQIKHLIEFNDKIGPKLEKIYNGYPHEPQSLPSVPREHIVFGMIARGIEKKGWQYAINAFEEANIPGARLLLYGDSSYLTKLNKENCNPNILFQGHTTQPLVAIEQFDVGLFPSFYEAESLPTTIIEYLIKGKPVITTDIAECKEMLRVDDSYAGTAIPLSNGLPDVKGFSSMMLSLAKSKQYYQQCSYIALRAAEKFEMSNCMNQYLELYKDK